MNLFEYFTSRTTELEYQIFKLTATYDDSILENFFVYEQKFNENKDELCNILLLENAQIRPENIFAEIGVAVDGVYFSTNTNTNTTASIRRRILQTESTIADFSENLYSSNFYEVFSTDCFLKTDLLHITGLKDSIQEIIGYLDANYKQFKKEIEEYIDLEEINTTTNNTNIEEISKLFNKKILSSTNLFFQDKIIEFNEIIQYYLNPALVIENRSIYNAIVKFIDSTYELDFIISPIFWFLLIIVFLFLFKIYLNLKKVLNTDKTVLFFLPAEMLNENERIEEAVKELKDLNYNY